MTISASTNAVDWSPETDSAPTGHKSRTGTGDAEVDLVLSQVDAVVAERTGIAVEDSSPESADLVPHGDEERTTANQVVPNAPAVLPLPPVREAPYTFRLLQQWEGTVTEIAVDEFTAELRDLTEPANYREEATFDLDEVSPGDQQLIALGAVFRWSIGYRTSSAGQRERVSQLRFVRIPGWRKSVIADIKQRAAELRERFPLT